MAAPRLLVLSANDAVRSRAVRAAAAANATVDLATTISSSAGWLQPRAVVVDAEHAPELARQSLPRRENVFALADEGLTAPQWQACLALGVSQVMSTAAVDRFLVQLMAQEQSAAPRANIGAAGWVCAVVGGCGGAGASVFAGAVACIAADRTATARQGVLLCDLDPYGAGVEVLLGMESHTGVRWPDIAAGGGHLDGAALHQVAPQLSIHGGSLSVVGFGPGLVIPPEPDTVHATVQAATRHGSRVVLDVARLPMDITERALAAATLTVVVIPAQVSACYATAKVISRLQGMTADLAAVVRGPSVGGLTAAEVADTIGVPLVATMRPQPGLARRIDAGRGIGTPPDGPLGRAARAVVQKLEVGP